MNIPFHGFFYFSVTKSVKLETSSQVILKPLVFKVLQHQSAVFSSSSSIEFSPQTTQSISILQKFNRLLGVLLDF